MIPLMTKIFILIFFLYTNIFANNWLMYLNEIRTSAGMTTLYENGALDDAAANHSLYLYHHDVMSHKENRMNMYFTGETPSQRCIAAGYMNCTENISFKNSNYKDSIDRLMSAIYHRFGFLNININEIGYAKADDNHNFVYNMGSNINITDEPVSSKNPNLILWPAEQAKDIIPMFTKEEPNPMPEFAFTGYPISIEFNNYYYQEIEEIEIKLFNKKGREIINTKLLDEKTDPNRLFTNLQFALFPIDRLDWSARYEVRVKYKALLNDYTTEEKEIKWNFWTRAYPYNYFVIDSDTKEINLRPNTNYTLYFIPKNSNETEVTKGIEHSTQNPVNMVQYIDYHTLNLNIGGPINTSLNLVKFDESKIKLNIRKQDSAISKDMMSDEELMALQDMERLNQQINSVKDNASELRRIGLQYYFGRGMKQDYEIAFRYLELAAKLKDKDAQVYLSSMYFKGQGIKRDVEKSEYWNNRYLSVEKEETSN